MAAPTDEGATTRSGEQPDAREAIQLFLGAIRRNLARVVFTTLVFLMLGTFLAMVWPSKYSSTTTFLVKEYRLVTDPVQKDELSQLPIPRKLQALSAELQSSKRISHVMDELQWEEWQATAGRPARRRQLYLKLRDNLDVEMNADVSGAINCVLTFQWTSPRKAADMVNRLRDSWMKLVLESHRRRLEQEKEIAERALLDREATLQAALAARRTYEQENNVPELLTVEINSELKADFLLKISEVQGQLEAVVTQIGIVRAELDAMPKEFEVEVPIDVDDPEQRAAYEAYLLAEASLAEVQLKYKPAHHAYRSAQQKLDLAKQALEDAGGQPGRFETKTVKNTDPAYYNKTLGLASLEDKERELKALQLSYEEGLRRAESNLEALPRVTSDLAALQADVDAAAGLVSQARFEVEPLREKVRTLRGVNSAIADSAGLVGGFGPFEVVDLGIEPEDPVLPIGAIIMAVALLVGIGLGLSGPVLAEMTRSSFGSVKEVSRSLGVPVLGAVDQILTRRDVRARSVQSVLTLTTMGLVLLALGTALYIYRFHQAALPAALLRAVRELELTLT